MKKVFALMNWGIFGLRSYWYIIQLLEILRGKDVDSSFMLTLIWALAAYVVPCLFWIPQLNGKREMFCVYEIVIGGSFFVYLIMDTGQISNFYLIPMLSIGYLLSRKVIVVVLISLLLPFAGTLFADIPFWTAAGRVSDTLLFFCIGLWAGFIGNAYRTNNLLMSEIEKQNRLLTQYSSQIERMTLLEERNRMSKELHDSLGHSYISFIMGLDAAIALLDNRPLLAREKLLRLRDLTEQNIHEMRELVHIMGDQEEGTISDQIDALANNFHEYTGTRVALQVSGPEQLLSATTRQSIIRIVQESLTNAVKHGNATQINIAIHYQPSRIRVTIHDNGKGMKEIKYGFGLTTMKKRIDDLDGQWQIESSPSTGTEIKCCLPIRGEKLA